MKVAIYSRGLDDKQRIPLLALISELHKHSATILVSASLAQRYWDEMAAIHNIQVFENNLDLDTDCLISLGGDGTILDAVTIIGNKNIPILGINFGRLGFLAGIGNEDISIAVDALVGGTYVTDKRILIHLDSDASLFGSAPFGLNEFGIHKRDTAPMIKIHTYLNGEFLNSYWADGLVVSIT
jgi:NAD+ kinase